MTGRLQPGDVYLVDVPFSDMPWESKVRPSVVVADGDGGDEGPTVLVRCFYSTPKPGRVYAPVAAGRGLRWGSFLDSRTVEVPMWRVGRRVGRVGPDEHPARRGAAARRVGAGAQLFAAAATGDERDLLDGLDRDELVELVLGSAAMFRQVAATLPQVLDEVHWQNAVAELTGVATHT